jgi:hypothetical protein
MSLLAVCGRLPLSFADDELRRVSAKHGEIMSVGTGVSRLDPLEQAESPVQCRGLGGPALAVLAEPEPGVEPFTATADLSFWRNGTLPGIVAGKRPEAGPIWSCGALPGTMAGKRSASRLIG